MPTPPDAVRRVLLDDNGYVEWKHGCDAITKDVTFWAPTVVRCPHCGCPAPDEVVAALRDAAGEADRD